MRRMSSTSAVALLLFCTGAKLIADGGSLQLRKQAGDLIVSVFTSPVPLRAGQADLSAMVQKTSDQSPIMDAKVMFHLLNRSADNVTEIALPARHSDASNKLLYAAKTKIPSPGQWTLRVDVEANHESLMAAGRIAVLPSEPPINRYWPYFALPLLCALAFALNRWLRRRMNFRSR